MTEKYLIDDEPIDPWDLIDLARDYDSDYDSQFLRKTSEAAKILRQHGFTVDYNREKP